MKRFLSGIIILGFGIVIGHMILPKFINSSEESKDLSGNSFKEKMQLLTDTDIAEYYQLKTLEEKYKKADEILGKIMTLILVDLGIRVSKTTLDEMNHKPLESAAAAAPPKPTEIKPSVSETVVQIKNADWKKSESLRSEIRDERDFPDFLEKVKINDLTQELKSSASFTNRTETLDSLKGRFYGQAQVKVKDKAHIWNVELSLDAAMEDGVLSGTARVIMSENGKVFSRGRDKGSIKSFRELTSGGQAVLIRASPGTYFQVYYLKDLDTLVGNVYERPSDEEPYVYIGTLSLKHSK